MWNRLSLAALLIIQSVLLLVSQPKTTESFAHMGFIIFIMSVFEISDAIRSLKDK